MKRNYWPLLFIGIFSFTFSMIIWTIYSAVQTPVHEDETFLKSYHDTDRSFNDIMFSNKTFLNKYDFVISINKREFPLIISDIFASQRVLEDKSDHKKLFINGENHINILIKNKDKDVVTNVIINLRITRPTNHHNTIDLKNEDFKFENNKYNSTVKLPLKGNWNINATFKIDDDIGYFYLKSDAI